MAWSGGSFTRTNGVFVGTTVWAQDNAAGVNIVDTRHDTHDQDLATGINTCLTKDGQNAATADLPMGGFKHTNVGVATALTHYARASQVQDSTLKWGGTSGGAANAQTITLTPAITAYAAGQRFAFIAGFTNTAACTLNVNSIGAKNIRKWDGTVALNTNDITANQVVEVIYDGTQFILSSPHRSYFLTSGVECAIGTLTNHEFQIYSNNTLVWKVNTTALSPNADATYNIGTTTRHVGTTYTATLARSGADLIVDMVTNHAIYFRTNGAIRWQINQDAANSFSPNTNATLSIGGASNHCNGVYARAFLSNGAAARFGTETAHSAEFHTNNTLRWSINSSGNLDPGAADTYAIGSTNRVISINTVGIINSSGALSVSAGGANSILFSTNSTTRWTITSGGELQPATRQDYTAGTGFGTVRTQNNSGSETLANTSAVLSTLISDLITLGFFQ